MQSQNLRYPAFRGFFRCTRRRSAAPRWIAMGVAMGLAIALLLLPAGCRRQAPRAPEAVRVLTPVYAIADVVRQIGGDQVSVEWLIESGQPLDPLVETADRRQQWNSANLVVTRGQIDPWTIQGAGNAYEDRRILRIDTLSAAGMSDPGHYLWLDPRLAMEIAEEVTDRLSALRSRGEQQFKSNRDDFVRQVATLMEESVTNVNRGGGGAFLTFDRGFLPLARRLGLTAVPLPRISLTEPTPYDVKALRELARTSGAGAIFASSEMPPTLLREWSTRLSMPVLTLDPVGTSARAGRSSYVELLRYNLAQLERGMALATGTPPTATGPTPLGAVQDSGLPGPTGPTRPPDRPVRRTDRTQELPPPAPGVTRPADAIARPPVPVAPSAPVEPPPKPFDPIGLPLPPVPATQPHSPFQPIPKSERDSP